MFKKSMVALGVAAFVVISSPTATMAASPTLVGATSCSGVLGTSYANDRIVSVSSPSVSPGGTVDVTWSPGYFSPGSPVTVNAGGGAGSQPVISLGSSSGTGTLSGSASGVGGVVASIAIPVNASGRINIAGMSDAACGGVSVTVVSSAQLKTLSLASTGGSLPTVLLVSGGAAVIFGAILIGARTRARRNLQQ